MIFTEHLLCFKYRIWHWGYDDISSGHSPLQGGRQCVQSSRTYILSQIGPNEFLFKLIWALSSSQFWKTGKRSCETEALVSVTLFSQHIIMNKGLPPWLISAIHDPKLIFQSPPKLSLNSSSSSSLPSIPSLVFTVYILPHCYPESSFTRVSSDPL